MRALTLHQPWATLVALGAKRFETRSWPTRYRGPLAIHAGKKLPPNWTPFRRSAFIDVLEPLVGLNEFGVPNIDQLPQGVIVAVCTLVDVLPTVHGMPLGWSLSDDELAFGDYGPGRYAWQLDLRYKTDEVPVRGFQGLWKVPPDVIVAL